MRLQTIQMLVSTFTFIGVGGIFTSMAASPAPQGAGQLITFVAGETARADDVNHNFTTLEERISALESETGVVKARYEMVHVEYFARGSRTDWHEDATCQLVNRSLSPITVGDVWVLGRGGLTDVLSEYDGLNGTVIPPLGRLDVPINDSIPGVVVQGINDPPRASTVVFEWTGNANALSLGVTIDRWKGTDEGRRHFVEGYSLTPSDQRPQR